MAQVVLENVSKRYGAVVAVERLGLCVEDREFVVLVGPSGCGKTTTLRMIAGLEEPTSGTIRIGGRLVNRVAPKDRNVAMVFQHAALYPHLNVFHNMAFGLKMRKAPKQEIQRRVRRAARLLEIEGLLERAPPQLSGGQRQRVALGRAIVRDADVYLLDDPFSDLDAQLRVSMRTELVKLHQRLAATVIHVTHDQMEAMMMGQRIAVMNAGRIQQVGSPLDIYHRPANRFVAGFIGTPPMNFFEGTLSGSGDGLCVHLGDWSLALAPGRHRQPSLRAGMAVTLGIRPEDIRIAGRDGGRGPRGRAELVLVQPLGAETILHLRRGDYEFCARVEGQGAWRRGEVVEICLDPTTFHLFDPELGNAL